VSILRLPPKNIITMTPDINIIGRIVVALRMRRRA
jgi:hypothetical protein